MKKSLEEFKGKEAIFIDANIFLHHAFNTNPASSEFLKKVESFHIKAYTSALVMEEVTFKLIMQSASNFLKKVTLYEVKRVLRNTEKRKNIFEPIFEYRAYINILKDLGLIIIELTDKDMTLALQKAGTYGLLTADAAHLS